MVLWVCRKISLFVGDVCEIQQGGRCNSVYCTILQLSVYLKSFTIKYWRKRRKL